MADLGANPTYTGKATLTTTPANEFAITLATVAGGISPWKNPTALISGLCDFRLANYWPSQGGNLSPLGDSVQVYKAQNYRLRTGFTAAVQPHQTEKLTAKFREPFGIDTGGHMWEPTLYTSPRDIRDEAKRKSERIMDGIETEVAKEAAKGHYGQAFVSNSKLVAPGDDSTPSTTRTGAKAISDATSYFHKTLGMLRPIKLCIDPAMRTGLLLDTLNAPFETTGAGAMAMGGDYEGKKLGVMWAPANLNGSQGFGTLASSGTIQVNAAPTEGGNTIVLKGVTSGTVPAVGTILYFSGRYATNRTTGEASSFLQPFRVTAASASGTTPTVTVDPPFRSSSMGENIRNRVVTSLPAADDTVYVNGLDSSVATNRTAYEGKTVDQSFIALADCISLTFAAPQLPSKGVVRSNMIMSDRNRVLLSEISYFTGGSTQTTHRMDTMLALLNWEPEASGRLFGRGV